MEYVSCDEVRQSVLELAVFRQLNGIIQLLKKQSQKKSFAGLRQRELCSVDDLSKWSRLLLKCSIHPFKTNVCFISMSIYIRNVSFLKHLTNERNQLNKLHY